LEIFGIGLAEMMLIALAALIILGPERLPEAARTAGRFIGDIRRATEPARSAFQEITEEINRAASSTTTVNQKPLGNPWEVHPIMQGMTEEEREAFIAGGDMPERVAAQLEEQSLALGTRNGTSPEDTPTLDYPMPHAELAYQPPTATEPEPLDYPPPA
jgi:sec-independent protein translocase protein TatB